MESTVKELLSRRSIRKYRREQITDAELDTVLEVGTYAPTASNKQSPLIVAVQDPDDIAEMVRLNAAVSGRPGNPLYGAPTVIVVFAERENRNGVQDASLVMGNLMNAAYAIGLGSCWINRAHEVFDMDDGKALAAKWGVDTEKYVGVGHCILGYPDESPAPKPRRDGYVLKIK